MTRATRGREPRTDPWPLVVVVLGAVLLALLGLAAMALLGFGPGDGSASPPPTATASDGAVASPSATPTSSVTPGPSEPAPAPSSSAVPGASETPTATPTGSPDGSPTPDVDPVTLCTGSDENRTFFRDAAEGLRFDVYCGVLPGGWTLTSGSYRGTGGGRLLVAYQRSGGAAVFLREGDFCGDDPDCLPAGTDMGSASFGDLEGRLVATDGGYAVVVEVEPGLAYVLEAIGVGEDGTREFGEDLVLVP